MRRMRRDGTMVYVGRHCSRLRPDSSSLEDAGSLARGGRRVNDRTCVPASAHTTTCVFPNHRVDASSVDHHAFERYLCLFISM